MELRKGYLNKLKDNSPYFKILLDQNPLNVQEIYSIIHTIAGTSGMYGLKDISETSTEFEFYLKPIKDNPDSMQSEELKNKFSNYINRIEKLISEGE